MNLDRKHRPRSWDEFVGNEKIVADLEALERVGDMPHLMFVGPPGSGKTTAELIIASNYLGRPISIGTQKGDPDFIVYNGSDARGIDVVRNDIKEKAKTRSQTYIDGVRLKRIIAIREIDNMTADAQHSLRDIIEVFEDRVFFILTLNRISGIKEPALISRCATFFFKRPTMEQSAVLFLNICQKEGVVLEDHTKMSLDVGEYYKGDLRHMLNDCLEALRGHPNPITKKQLWKVYEQNATSVAKRVRKSLEPRATFFEIYKTEGFDVRDFLEEFYDLIDTPETYSKAFALIDERLREKCSEQIQMNYFFTMLGL